MVRTKIFRYPTTRSSKSSTQVHARASPRRPTQRQIRQRCRQRPVLDQERRGPPVAATWALGGWATEYCMPMDDDPEPKRRTPLSARARTPASRPIKTGEGDDAEPAMTNDGEDVETDLGKGTLLLHGLTPTTSPPWSTSRAAEDQDKDMGRDVGADRRAHALPQRLHPSGRTTTPSDEHRRARQGPHLRHLRRRRASTVGVYREPTTSRGSRTTGVRLWRSGTTATMSKIEVELMYSENDGGRLKKYDYDDVR